MYKIQNAKDETLGYAKTIEDAKKLAEKLSYKETVYLTTEHYDLEYPKKEEH